MITRPGASTLSVAKLHAVTGAIRELGLVTLAADFYRAGIVRGESETLKNVGPHHLGIGQPCMSESARLSEGDLRATANARETNDSEIHQHSPPALLRSQSSTPANNLVPYTPRIIRETTGNRSARILFTASQFKSGV
jgi:hypothetical protein